MKNIKLTNTHISMLCLLSLILLTLIHNIVLSNNIYVFNVIEPFSDKPVVPQSASDKVYSFFYFIYFNIYMFLYETGIYEKVEKLSNKISTWFFNLMYNVLTFMAKYTFIGLLEYNLPQLFFNIFYNIYA